RMETCSYTPSRSRSSQLPIAKLAPAQTAGFPPKVEPWLPCPIPAATLSLTSTAPMGRPPPSPLARVTMSGRRLYCSQARKVPVRPTPVCTSSTIRSEEHTSELQSRFDLVCRLLLEKNKYM